MFKISRTNNIGKLNSYIGSEDTIAHGATIKNGKIIPNKNGIKYRNLPNTIGNFNLPYGDAKKSTQYCRKLLSTCLRKHKTQGYQIIINPKRKMNPNNPDDVNSLLTLTKNVARFFAKRGIPVRYALQADNDKKQLHSHILILNMSIKTNKAIPSWLTYEKKVGKDFNKIIDRTNNYFKKNHLSNYRFHHWFNKKQVQYSNNISSIQSLAMNDYIKVVNKNKVPTKNGKHTMMIGSLKALNRGLKPYGLSAHRIIHRKYYRNPTNNKRIVKGKYKNGKPKYKYKNVYGLTITYDRYKGNKHYQGTIKGSTIKRITGKYDYNYLSHLFTRNNQLWKQNQKQKYLHRKSIKKNEKINKQKKQTIKENHINTDDVKVVARNVSLPAQQGMFTQLNEIRPIREVRPKLATRLNKVHHQLRQQRHITIAPADADLIQGYNNHLHNWLSRKRKIEENKYRSKGISGFINHWKTVAINKFKSEAYKIGGKAKKFGLNKFGELLQKPLRNTVSNEAKAVDDKDKHNEAISNHIYNKYEKPNRRIILKPKDVTVRDITHTAESVNNNSNTYSINLVHQMNHKNKQNNNRNNHINHNPKLS